MVFAHEDSPSLMVGAYDIVAGNVYGKDKVRDVFANGKGC